MTPLQMLDKARMAAQHVMRPAPPAPPVVAPPAAPIVLPDGNYTMTDPGAFFTAVRAITGPLDQVQVDTINRLLAGATRWRATWLAYGLATAWHEARMKPIPEWGKGKGRAYAKPGKYGQSQYGRGLVQLTWDFNYEWADKALGLNGSLLRNFDRMLEPDISARTLVLGMETGAFTGKALRHYLTGDNATREQFRQARRIINGMDKADLIAGYAERFLMAIAKGGWRD